MGAIENETGDNLRTVGSAVGTRDGGPRSRPEVGGGSWEKMGECVPRAHNEAQTKGKNGEESERCGRGRAKGGSGERGQPDKEELEERATVWIITETSERRKRGLAKEGGRGSRQDVAGMKLEKRAEES